MGMVVRSNIMAVNAQRQLGVNNSQVSKALEKLSSGYRINRAGDDASGLAISEKMKAQIKGLDTASLNSQDGISVVQTAEGALTEVHNMLNRMTELATRSANGINDDINRESLQQEITQLKSEIDRISESTTFNGRKLLNGEMGVSVYTTTSASYKLVNGAGVATAAVVELDFSKMVDAQKITDLKDGATITIKGASGATVTFKFVDSTTGLATVSGTTFIQLTGKVSSTIAALATKLAASTTLSADGKELGIASATVTGSTSTTIKITMDPPTSKTNVEDMKGIELVATSNLGMRLQIGDTADSYNQLGVAVSDMSSKGIGIDKLDISTQDGAAEAIDTIRNAIDKVSSQRAVLGATQNRLEYTINNLDTTSENVQAANSRIRDTDMAKMMMEYTKTNVLTQSAQAMLAQANQQPQSVLQLLQ